MNETNGTMRISLILIGGISIGIIAGWFLAPPEEEKENPLLVSSIEALTEAVKRVEEALIDSGNLARSSMGDSNPGVERVSIRSSSEEDLGIRFEGIESAIGNLVNSLSTQAGSSLPVREVKDLTIFGTYPINVSAFGALEPQSEIERTLTYLDWDYQQVLNHFGSPTNANTDNGVVYFFYEDLPGRIEVRLGFMNGRVIEVDRWKD